MQPPQSLDVSTKMPVMDIEISPALIDFHQGLEP
jgi:hypothetical protein